MTDESTRLQMGASWSTVLPLFEEHANATLDRVRQVFTQRGSEYSDTWRTCRFHTMKAVAKELGCEIEPDHFRALATAAFVDMKQERVSGGYKEDSLVDDIAYKAFLVEEMRRLKA